jgi:hypothetical protein
MRREFSADAEPQVHDQLFGTGSHGSYESPEIPQSSRKLKSLHRKSKVSSRSIGCFDPWVRRNPRGCVPRLAVVRSCQGRCLVGLRR